VEGVALFGAKYFGFIKIYGCVRTDKGGRRLSQYGHFTDKEEGSIYRDFIRTFFLCTTVIKTMNTRFKKIQIYKRMLKA